MRPGYPTSLPADIVDLDKLPPPIDHVLIDLGTKS
jgi:hypothetical protein